MDASFETGLSIVRGYSRSGLGEGPGRPVANGEQYLSADPRFAEDADLLAAVRPWLTLDVESGDLRKVADRLEAWSVFSHGAWGFVARLAPAGTFDRRTAYLSHALGFDRESFGTAEDPGAWVGRPERFPFPGEGVPGTGSGSPPPAGTTELAAEPELATSLLAGLLQALLGGPPVLLAVPVENFATGSPVHGLVAFARAALPSPLKEDVRLRIYTRNPELFLERLGTHLLVVPEDLASAALAVRRDALVLDRTGARVAGAEPDGSLTDYARGVVSEATDAPGSLLAFTVRLGRRIWRGDRLPDESTFKHLRLAYGIAERLARPDGAGSSLLVQFRSVAGQDDRTMLRWRDLLVADDWLRFPVAEVFDLVLADPATLPVGGRELQAAGVDAAAEIGLFDGGSLRSVWEPRDAGRIGRFLELAELQPDLLPEGELAKLLRAVPDERLRETGRVGVALRLEATVGDLAHRLPEEDRRDHGVGLLDDLPTDELLELARSVHLGRGLTPLARCLSERWRVEPVETTRALILHGGWSWWRSRQGPDPPERRRAALRWLALGPWNGELSVDPLLEDWDRVMDDLGGRLDPVEVRSLLEAPGESWPWIPLFEERQVRDLARRMPDLGLLAAWIARCVPPALGAARTEAAALSAFLAGRPMGGDLPPDALRWFGDRPPSGGTLPEEWQLAVLRSLAGESLGRLDANLSSLGLRPPGASTFGLSTSTYVRSPDTGVEVVAEYLRSSPRDRRHPGIWREWKERIESRAARPEIGLALLARIRGRLCDDERRAMEAGTRTLSAVRDEHETRSRAMNQVVTFFTDQGPDQRIFTRRLRDGRSFRTVVVWTPDGIDPGLDGLLSGQNSRVAEAIDNLWQRVAEEGGVLADSGPGGRLRVHAALRGGEAVSRALLLSAVVGDEPVSLDSLGQGVQLSPGQHLLMPVSAGAEMKLLQLRELLAGMGKDVRGMVMQTLRSPSLDTRVALLEELVVAKRRSGWLRGLWRRWREWSSSPVGRGRWTRGRVLLIPLIALALLVVLGAGLQLVRHPGWLQEVMGLFGRGGNGS